jgi:hypothetical protein
MLTTIALFDREAVPLDLVEVAPFKDPEISASGCLCLGGPAPGALVVSMKVKAPSLAEPGIRTWRSSPMAAILMGGSAPLEWTNSMLM